MASEAPEEPQEGSIELLPDDPLGVEDTDDGGAIVRVEDVPEAQEAQSFYANIAPKLDPTRRRGLGQELERLIAEDIEARKKRDEVYAEAIQKTGVTGESGGGVAFPGSSKAVHPMIAKACIDFSARTIKELLPASDVVKAEVLGKQTKERVQRARRKSSYMSWQVKKQMPEFRAELEQLLTQLPMGGSQYLYMYWDSDKKRPVPQFWSVDDVILPESAGSFMTAERVTMRERITHQEFKRRVKRKLYDAPEDSPAPTLAPELTKAGEQLAKAEGKTPTAMNVDGMRELHRVHCWLELEDDELAGGEMAPYIVEVDQQSCEVLSLTRNWDYEDELKEQMHWLVDFTFLYWKGAQGLGLYHILGSLATAATGAVRALLDSAHVNNLPTALVLKGSNMSGQAITLNPGELTPVEGGVTGDDIRKLVMAVPFNPPSVVLLQLLGMITEFGEGIVRTTFDNLAEGNRDMPVGTTLALIEQGMKVLGAIHLRLYGSMSKVFEILHRINSFYLTSEQVETDTGSVMVRREDFTGPPDVVPVADPETFSDVQRFARMQMIAQRAMLIPTLYDLRKVEEMILESSKLPDAKSLLLPAMKPQIMNPVNENAAMSLGRPVVAHPEQDHLAHMQVHLDYGRHPMLGGNPLISQQFWPQMLGHIKEHLVYFYVDRMRDVTSKAMGSDITKVMAHKDPETQSEVDKTLAAASPRVMAQVQEAFSELPPIIQQAMAMVQQMQPNMPMDPKLGAAQIQAQSKAQDRQANMAMQDKELQARGMSEQQKAVVDIQKAREQAQAKAQADAAREREVTRREEMKQHAQGERDAAKQQADTMQQQANNQAQALMQAQELASKEQMNVEDNQTALTIAAAEIESGEKVAVENGKGINKNPGG